MILKAVIVGYILGITPLIVIKILESKDRKLENIRNEKQSKEQTEIFNEWLNGKESLQKQPTHINLFNEYMTGKITSEEGE